MSSGCVKDNPDNPKPLVALSRQPSLCVCVCVFYYCPPRRQLRLKSSQKTVDISLLLALHATKAKLIDTIRRFKSSSDNMCPTGDWISHTLNENMNCKRGTGQWQGQGQGATLSYGNEVWGSNSSSSSSVFSLFKIFPSDLTMNFVTKSLWK